MIRRINAVIAGSERSIRKKLLYSFLVISVVPLTAIGVILYLVTYNELLEEANFNLETIGKNKAASVEEFLEESLQDLNVLSEMAVSTHQQAMNRLEILRDRMSAQVETYMLSRIENIRIMSNDPTVYRALKAFESAGSTGGSLWRSTAEKYGPWMTLYKDTYGFKNIYIVSTSGRILYSVEKKSDLGENLKTGSLENSPAGKAFQKGLKMTSLQDYEAYEPLNNLPAGFAAAPIKSGETVVGVILGQISIDPINKIMRQTTGLSDRTEAYLVAKIEDEILMRSKRTVTDEDVGDPHSGTYVKKAYAGITGNEKAFDEKGVYRNVSYSTLNIPGLKWAIQVATPVEDIFSYKYEGAQSDLLTYFAEHEEFLNLSIVSPDGYLFYSVLHYDDYHTNLHNGPYKDTHLGRLINQTSFTRKPLLSDFERYKPSDDIPAGFAAWPVVVNDELIFTVVAQISNIGLQTIMEDVAGLGNTGETYMVGEDNMWRTDSRFLEEIKVDSTLLNPRLKVSPEIVSQALSQISDASIEAKALTGTEESDGTAASTEPEKSAVSQNATARSYINYRDKKVLSVSSAVVLQEPNTYNPNGVKWAIFSEMELAEIHAPIYRLGYIFAGIITLTVMSVLFLSFLLSEGFTLQINHIMNLFSEIGIGNYSARTEVISQDELGQMALSLNAMLDNTLSLIQSQEDRDTMQSAVMKLLNEISALTNGDLTVRAEVTEHITGAIADSFNAMAEQLAEIIRGVKDATLRVGYTSSQVSDFTGRLANMSEKQSNQVKKAIAVINEITQSIQQIAEKATTSAAVSKQSMQSAKKGAKAVEDTNQAMNNIRERVQETARAIKRLGESSQEIGNIIQIINDISDRTSILSLNASIQAATAGEAGHGFAVVAEEVQRLAERSSMSTKQIEILVKNIQGDIQEAGRSMDESIQRVVEGSALANDAHSTLQEIESISSQVAEMVDAISLVSKEQAVASETATRTMTAVGEISTQTSKASKQTALSMQIMSKIAERLRISVEAFKVEKKSIEKPGRRKTVVKSADQLEDQRAKIA